MSYIIHSKYLKKNLLFVHIPKNAGNSFIAYCKQCSFKVYRPSLLIGHLTYSETKSRVDYLRRKFSHKLRFLMLQKSFQDKPCEVVYIYRNPVHRAYSMYSYIKRYPPRITGHYFEHELFSRITVDEYIDHLVSRAYYGTSHAWNNQSLYLESLNMPDSLQARFHQLSLANIEIDFNNLISNLLVDHKSINLTEFPQRNQSDQNLIYNECHDQLLREFDPNPALKSEKNSS